MIDMEPLVEMELIEGHWQLVRSTPAEPNQTGGAKLIAYMISLGFAIALRLALWGPIHH